MIFFIVPFAMLKLKFILQNTETLSAIDMAIYITYSVLLIVVMFLLSNKSSYKQLKPTYLLFLLLPIYPLISNNHTNYEIFISSIFVVCALNTAHNAIKQIQKRSFAPAVIFIAIFGAFSELSLLLTGSNDLNFDFGIYEELTHDAMQIIAILLISPNTLKVQTFNSFERNFIYSQFSGKSFLKSDFSYDSIHHVAKKIMIRDFNLNSEWQETIWEDFLDKNEETSPKKINRRWFKEYVIKYLENKHIESILKYSSKEAVFAKNGAADQTIDEIEEKSYHFVATNCDKSHEKASKVKKKHLINKLDTSSSEEDNIVDLSIEHDPGGVGTLPSNIGSMANNSCLEIEATSTSTIQPKLTKERHARKSFQVNTYNKAKNISSWRYRK